MLKRHFQNNQNIFNWHYVISTCVETSQPLHFMNDGKSQKKLENTLKALKYILLIFFIYAT